MPHHIDVYVGGGSAFIDWLLQTYQQSVNIPVDQGPVPGDRQAISQLVTPHSAWAPPPVGPRPLGCTSSHDSSSVYMPVLSDVMCADVCISRACFVQCSQAVY